MKLLEKVSSKPNTSSLTLGGVNYGEYPNRGAMPLYGVYTPHPLSWGFQPQLMSKP